MIPKFLNGKLRIVNGEGEQEALVPKVFQQMALKFMELGWTGWPGNDFNSKESLSSCNKIM